MLIKINKESMGTANHGWLESRFHFSFAEYRNSKNMNFGVLRVLNDDIIHPKSGFDMHPHENMEIITYIIKGEITHKDSMGNKETLKAGEVQYLSAGDGIYHSEYNPSEIEELNLLQIWIIPPKKGLERLYGSHKFTPEEKQNKLLNIVSSQEGNAQIKIYQDVNFYVSKLDADKILEFKINKKRQVYFVQIEGSSLLNKIELKDGDAMEIIQESNINIKALNSSHFLLIEMKEA
jgi:redox-sensitive bicupin YhaK (pirin superfamily)